MFLKLFSDSVVICVVVPERSLLNLQVFKPKNE